MRHVETLETRTLLATYTVANVDGLIAAITAANKTSAADTINLKAGKTFTLSKVNNNEDGPTGLPAITKPLIINGNGSAIERSGVTGTPAFRFFDVNSGASLSLNNLTLKNGRSTGYSYVATTGLATRPTTSPKGGTVGTTGFPSGISGTTYNSTRHQARGGAIFNEGSLTLNRVTLSNNTASGLPTKSSSAYVVVQHHIAGYAKGGAIYSAGTLKITGSSIRSNSATGVYAPKASRFSTTAPGTADGGGIFIAGGNATIDSSTFSSNSAKAGNGPVSGAGGGICISGGTLTVSKSTFASNKAQGGNNSARPTPSTPSVAGNGYGGGIAVFGGTLKLRNAAITANTAEGGVAMWNDSDGKGIGGGAYFSSTAIVHVDPFSKANITNNVASEIPEDIFGTYELV